MIPPLMSLDIDRDLEPRPTSDPSPSSSRDSAERPPAPSGEHASHRLSDDEYRRVVEPLLPREAKWETLTDHQLLHDIVVCKENQYDDILTMVRRANEMCATVSFGLILKNVKDRRLAQEKENRP